MTKVHAGTARQMKYLTDVLKLEEHLALLGQLFVKPAVTFNFEPWNLVEA